MSVRFAVGEYVHGSSIHMTLKIPAQITGNNFVNLYITYTM